MAEDIDLADPAPLGLIGFALTTFIVGLIEANWLTSEGAVATLVPLAMAYGGTIQLLAGVLSYPRGNMFATVGFNTYGAFWWWWALTQLFAGNGWISPSTTTVGAILLGFGVITTGLWVATFNLNWGLWTVFLTLSLAFYFLGFGDLLGIDWAVVVGGYVSMLTALCAAYVSFAEVTNWSFGETRIPLGGTPFGSSSNQ